MLRMLNTLLLGLLSRKATTSHAHPATDPISDTIRDVEGALRAAQAQLADLVQQDRMVELLLAQAEHKRAAALDARADKPVLGSDAPPFDTAGLLQDCARHMAVLVQLRTQAAQQRLMIEAMHHRLFSLRQGAIRARALRREAATQLRLGGTARAKRATRDADVLIHTALISNATYKALPSPCQNQGQDQGRDVSKRLAA